MPDAFNPARNLDRFSIPAIAASYYRYPEEDEEIFEGDVFYVNTSEGGRIWIAGEEFSEAFAIPTVGSVEAAEEADDLFEMANLFPKTTGLPMTVWVSARGGARHDARVKVDTSRGPLTAVIGVRPAPHLIVGHLPAADLEAVSQWISLNKDALIELWEGQIDSVGFAQKHKSLPATVSSPANVRRRDPTKGRQ